MGRYDEAEAAYRQAVALQEAAVQAAVPDPRDVHALAKARFQLANLLRTMGRIEEAQRQFQAALETHGQPDVVDGVDFRPGRADTWHKLGSLEIAIGRFVEGERNLRQSLNLQRQLVEEQPADRDRQLALAQTETALAALLTMLSRFADAGTLLDSAVARQEKLLAASSTGPVFRLGLARTLAVRAHLLDVSGRHKESEADLIRLDAPGPVMIELNLAVNRTEAALVDVKDIIKDVTERVIEKRRQLEQERRGQRRLDQRQMENLNKAIDSIDAYMRLHNLQIEPAFTGSDSTTLAEMIARTGSPDGLVADVLTPLTVQPVCPPAPVAMPVVPPARPTPPLRHAAAPARSAVAKGSFIGKMFKLAMVTMVTVGGGGYAAYASGILPKPAEQWVKNAIAQVRTFATELSQELSGKPSGDVMTALRQSTDELGWKRDVEQELSLKQLRDLIGGLPGVGEQLAAIPQFDEKHRLYLAGEAIPGMERPGGEFKDLPIPCRRALLVYDFRTAEAAAEFLDAGRRLAAANGGRITELTVPGADRGVSITVPGGVTQSSARLGQYVLATNDGDPLPGGTEIQEHQRRLTVLAAKLGGKATSTTAPKSGDKTFDEEREGVLGVPLPGARKN